MTPMIFGFVLAAAARKVKMDPGVRQDDGRVRSRAPLAEAITSQFECLANAGTHFLTHLVE